ncbi:hypothetical protein [Pueribacillus sp. YX66]|uniref:hypothetical protein n=1 Tax=Pueribacillus sp. YX66 TaxID=3229242 RepID=UPI00358D6D17
MNLSTEKIQDAICSATVTQVNMEGREIYIKNKSDDAFADILKALKLKNIPAYGKNDMRINAYIQKKK